MRRILLFFLILAALPVSAQKTILSGDARISILTCASGNELYSLFGHTAIRVSDPANALDTVYNFGAFDFSTPNFYLKFIKGDLQYFVVTSSYSEFLEEYIYLKRSVYEQQLNLMPIQKQFLFDRLEEILNSNEKFYTYKFIDRNCTTLAADVVARTTGTPMSLAIKDAGKTNRRILYGYIQDHFYENLGISIMFGAKTDKKLYKVYLPLQLLESIPRTTNKGVPLTSDTRKVVDAKADHSSFSWWNNFYTYALVLLFLALTNKKLVYLTYFFIAGLLGIFLCSVGFYSFHEELSENYNALLFNPLLLPLALAIMRRNALWTRNILLLAAGLLLLYFVYMLNKPHFLLLLPVIGLHGILFAKVWSGLRKRSLTAPGRTAPY
jgi:hypothetical protein